ncbi:hypothetical protein BDY19DRAFT_906571 [Irpex rosettiformis]|uniref:Uncharacterized protein n=1 Tax=Irpex rosettiformis TaxID=378272 RepID=A0ACB8U2G1_9APHY|nr:hypothetical protein BDY19DRAFT_906571 [Irpex rosettiformis]
MSVIWDSTDTKRDRAVYGGEGCDHDDVGLERRTKLAYRQREDHYARAAISLGGGRVYQEREKEREGGAMNREKRRKGGKNPPKGPAQWRCHVQPIGYSLERGEKGRESREGTDEFEWRLHNAEFAQRTLPPLIRWNINNTIFSNKERERAGGFSPNNGRRRRESPHGRERERRGKRGKRENGWEIEIEERGEPSRELTDSVHRTGRGIRFVARTVSAVCKEPWEREIRWLASTVHRPRPSNSSARMNTAEAFGFKFKPVEYMDPLAMVLFSEVLVISANNNKLALGRSGSQVVHKPEFPRMFLTRRRAYVRVALALSRVEISRYLPNHPCTSERSSLRPTKNPKHRNSGETLPWFARLSEAGITSPPPFLVSLARHYIPPSTCAHGQDNGSLGEMRDPWFTVWSVGRGGRAMMMCNVRLDQEEPVEIFDDSSLAIAEVLGL